MSDIKINNVTNRNGDTGPIIAGVSTVSSSAFMVMPSGDTAIRGAGSGRGVFGGTRPPPNTPRIEFPPPWVCIRASVNWPKEVPFPVDVI